VNQVYYCILYNINLGLTLSELLKHIKNVSLNFSIYGVNNNHYKFLLFILVLKNPLHPSSPPVPPLPSVAFSVF